MCVCVLGCVAKNLEAETEIGRCLENKTWILNSQTTTQKKLKIGVSSPKMYCFLFIFKVHTGFYQEEKFRVAP